MRGRLVMVIAAVSALVLVTVLGGPGAARTQRGDRGFVLRGAATSYGSTKPVWPQSMCAKRPGHRFMTTTQGDKGSFLGEPAAPRQYPHLTAHQAYRHFERIYGKLTAAERRNTQVRFGRITDDTEGTDSANAIGAVPMTRRAPAWLISNCAVTTPPRGTHRTGHKPGLLLFIVTDKTRLGSLGWEYRYTDASGSIVTRLGGGSFPGIPPPGSTSYRSVRWRVVASSPRHWQLLLHYRQVPGYSFDHINVNEDERHTATITVILSTASHGRPAWPSAIAPYMTAFAESRPFTTLRHGHVGQLTYQPVSGGGGTGASPG